MGTFLGLTFALQSFAIVAGTALAVGAFAVMAVIGIIKFFIEFVFVDLELGPRWMYDRTYGFSDIDIFGYEIKHFLGLAFFVGLIVLIAVICVAFPGM